MENIIPGGYIKHPPFPATQCVTPTGTDRVAGPGDHHPAQLQRCAFAAQHLRRCGPSPRHIRSSARSGCEGSSPGLLVNDG